MLFKAKAKLGNNVARQCCLKFYSLSCRRNIVAKLGNIVGQDIVAVVVKERAKFAPRHILYEDSLS